MQDAAFGATPGTWPLPTATTADQRWLRAVASGGQGRYACAIAELDQLRHEVGSGSLASLAQSTHASFLRQLGWHDHARVLDGRAWALSDGRGEAAADALIGLAADALGVGRFAAAARALERAAGRSADSPRLQIRLAWVSAELAMVRGEGAEAVGHAERAVDLAADFPSSRHAVKSRIVLAAAHCSAGYLAAAHAHAREALVQTGRLGLVPLRWAAACLLADSGDVAAATIRDEAAGSVTRWGGVWRSR